MTSLIQNPQSKMEKPSNNLDEIQLEDVFVYFWKIRYVAMIGAVVGLLGVLIWQCWPRSEKFNSAISLNAVQRHNNTQEKDLVANNVNIIFSERQMLARFNGELAKSVIQNEAAKLSEKDKEALSDLADGSGLAIPVLSNAAIRNDSYLLFLQLPIAIEANILRQSAISALNVLVEIYNEKIQQGLVQQFGESELYNTETIRKKEAETKAELYQVTSQLLKMANKVRLPSIMIQNSYPSLVMTEGSQIFQQGLERALWISAVLFEEKYLSREAYNEIFEKLSGLETRYFNLIERQQVNERIIAESLFLPKFVSIESRSSGVGSVSKYNELKGRRIKLAHLILGGITGLILGVTCGALYVQFHSIWPRISKIINETH